MRLRSYGLPLRGSHPSPILGGRPAAPQGPTPGVVLARKHTHPALPEVQTTCHPRKAHPRPFEAAARHLRDLLLGRPPHQTLDAPALRGRCAAPQGPLLLGRPPHPKPRRTGPSRRGSIAPQGPAPGPSPAPKTSTHRPFETRFHRSSETYSRAVPPLQDRETPPWEPTGRPTVERRARGVQGGSSPLAECRPPCRITSLRGRRGQPPSSSRCRCAPVRCCSAPRRSSRWPG